MAKSQTVDNIYCFDRSQSEQIDVCLHSQKEYEDIIAKEKTDAEISPWVRFSIPLILGIVGGMYLQHNLDR